MTRTPARIATLPDESTVEYAERVIECCRVLDAAGDDVILNASECAAMDGFAIVVLAATFARRRIVSEKATRLDPPRRTEVATLFDRFRFADLLAGALPQWEAAQSVEGRQLRAHDTDYVDCVASAGSDASENGDADAKFAVNLCLLELLTNGGLGLGNLRQQVATRGGVMHVIAGTALARFGPDLEITAITMGTSFDGTVVHAFFDPHRTPVAPTEASEVF